MTVKQLKDNTSNILHNFMEKYKVKSKPKSKSKMGRDKTMDYTHASYCDRYGKYCIPEDRYTEFKKLYTDAVLSGKPLHITEKKKPYGPLSVDVNLISEESKRVYQESDIRKIVSAYNRIIKKYLKTDVNKMSAYVSEHKSPIKTNGEYHDNLTITYPYICVDTNLQLIIHGEFLKVAEQKGIFNKMNIVNDIEDVVGRSMNCNAEWLMYGSSRDGNLEPYTITHIYESCGREVYDSISPLEKLLTRENVSHFVDKTSCRRFYTNKNVSTVKDDVTYMDINDKIHDIKCNLVNKKGEEAAALFGLDNIKINKASKQDYNEAIALCKIMSADRASDRYTWYQIGRCLFDIDMKLLDTWIEFTQKSNIFSEDDCREEWAKMRPTNYTLATLHYFARIDNKVEYTKLNAIDKKLLEECSHTSVAKILLSINKYEFKCASIKHKMWFHYQDNKWKEIDSACLLRNRIDTKLVDIIRKKMQNILQECIDNDIDGKDMSRMLTSSQNILRKLGESGFKDNVIKECSYILYAQDPDFLSKLNEDVHLIGFSNGVYDLEQDIFRPGTPDDYISMNTTYDFKMIDEDDHIFRQYRDFVDKVQDSDTMRTCVRRIFSTTLSGSISDEKFYVLTGSGANGKSKIVELMKYTLGEYYSPMDIRILTQKRGASSSASPELADKKGVRMCTLDEPEASDEINTGFMKQFTGGDIIQARALYKENTYFVPQFKPFLLCNKLPKMKDDGGVWRRVIAIEFPNKFIKHSEASKKMKKKGLPKGHYWADDDNLTNKLKSWKQACMSDMIREYRKYKKEGLIIPKRVHDFTKEYRKKCDVYQDFLGDYIERTDNMECSVSIGALNIEMKTWYRANYDGKYPGCKELREYVSNKYQTYNKQNDCIYGYIIKGGVHDDIDEEINSISKE